MTSIDQRIAVASFYGSDGGAGELEGWLAAVSWRR